MSRNRFCCEFCGEPLVHKRPATGQVKPIGAVPYEWVEPNVSIKVTCPHCGEERVFDLKPKEQLKPAA